MGLPKIRNPIAHDGFYSSATHRLGVSSPLPVLGFGFSLSGRSRVRADGRKEGRAITPGQAVFNCFPEIAGLTEIVGKERVVRVGIMMDLERFYAFAEEGMNAVPPQLGNISTGISSHEGRITTAMHTTIGQICNCPYQGWVKSFFLESKAMELMAHKIAHL